MLPGVWRIIHACITTLIEARSARLKLTPTAPQRFLLAEIIKTSRVSIDTLLGIIKKEHIEPSWNEIFIPPGKSLRT
jgi:hypothetical protein